MYEKMGTRHWHGLVSPYPMPQPWTSLTYFSKKPDTPKVLESPCSKVPVDLSFQFFGRLFS